MPSDYELPPKQVQEYNEVIAQARDAFQIQQSISQELEEQWRNRNYLKRLGSEGGKKE